MLVWRWLEIVDPYKNVRKTQTTLTGNGGELCSVKSDSIHREMGISLYTVKSDSIHRKGGEFSTVNSDSIHMEKRSKRTIKIVSRIDCSII